MKPELVQWMQLNLANGVPAERLLVDAQAAGWHASDAEFSLQAALNPSPAIEPNTQAMPEPCLDNNPCYIDTFDRRVYVGAVMSVPRVVVFNNLLSDDECDALVALAQPKLTRSSTVNSTTGAFELHPARTSDGTFFHRGENPLCERIEQRIAELVRWPVENGEGLQILRYTHGANYTPHHDYFDPSAPGSAAVLKTGGNRVATLVMYLQAPEHGGATTFPDVGLAIAPVKGSAVFFSYAQPHPNTKTLHGGAPVTRGEKYVATKWLRERAYR